MVNVRAVNDNTVARCVPSIQMQITFCRRSSTCSNNNAHLNCLHSQSQGCKSRIHTHTDTSAGLISHVCHLRFDPKARMHTTSAALITSCFERMTLLGVVRIWNSDFASTIFALTPPYPNSTTRTCNRFTIFFARIGHRNISRAVRKSESDSLHCDAQHFAALWLRVAFRNRRRHNIVGGRSGPQFIAGRCQHSVVIVFLVFIVNSNDRTRIENVIGKKHKRH